MQPSLKGLYWLLEPCSLTAKFHHQIDYDHFKYWEIYKSGEEFEEAQEKCEYPPRLMITYTRNDPSVSLQCSFHVEKEKKDKKSMVIAEFQLLKAAKGMYVAT